MGNTIKFGIHSNPLPDKEGRETYHVRHETDLALNLDYIVDQVRHYNESEASHVKAVVDVLRRHIVETLTDNHNVHIDGLGNFYLKLGFRKRTDENGLEVKPHFTDPSKITGNDVVVETINFTPDEEFLKLLLRKNYHYVNATGRGKVGHSAKVNLPGPTLSEGWEDSQHSRVLPRLNRQYRCHWLTEYCLLPDTYVP